MKLDIITLRSDLHALEQRIRALKLPLRRPWTHPMGSVQAQLRHEADQATALCTLLAWSRGRLHRTNPPAPWRDAARDCGSTQPWDAVEHNRCVAARVAPRYTSSSAEPYPPAVAPAVGARTARS
ncbi:MAG: hypothetical protein K0V04_33975 [Deltaproteobacteria bacterium]|nr:hypothetical protein [Deltaproteobacteria bacterium]